MAKPEDAWEYTVVYFGGNVSSVPPHSDEFIDTMNAMGEEGWELVTVYNGNLFYKRPVDGE